MSNVDPRGLRKFLNAVAWELGDLGPLERRRALKRVREDVVELAADGTSGWPEEDDVLRAVRSMPDPKEMAGAYLETARPPLRLTQISLILNALAGLPPALLALVILHSLLTSPMGWVHPLFLLAVLAILSAGLAVMTVYFLALLSPARALRWRFAVLLPATVCLIIDGPLAVAFFLAGSPNVGYGFLLAVIVLLGGSYSVAYAHGQMPRLVPEGFRLTKETDYFSAIALHLRDLDLVSRRVAVEDLRSHAEAEGLAPASLPPRERYAALVRGLGPPEEVAAGYLRDVPKDLSRRQRIRVGLLLTPAFLGLVLGGIILGFALIAGVWESVDLTPLGLLSSIGLFLLSLAIIGHGLRMMRSPAKVADHLMPAAILALVAALILAAAMAGALSGGLMERYRPRDYDIWATHIDEDGGMGVLWSSATCVEASYPLDCWNFGSRDFWLTRLDAERRVLSTERVGYEPLTTPILDMTHDGTVWAVLTPHSLVTWGGYDSSQIFAAPSAWEFVEGDIEEGSATVAWVTYDRNLGAGAVTVHRTDTRGAMQGEEWSRGFEAIGGPGTQFAGIAVSREAVFLLTQSWNENRTAAAIGASLLSASGDWVANLTILERTVPAGWPEGRENSVHLDARDPVAGGGAFWIALSGERTVNETTTGTHWLARIDAADGSLQTWEIHQETWPTAHDLPSPGDVSPLHYPSLFVTEERVLVTSTWSIGVIDEDMGWQPDPSRGGYFVTNFLYSGEVEYRLKVADIEPDTFPGPAFASQGTVHTLFLQKWRGGDLSGTSILKAYVLAGPVPTVETHEVILDPEASRLFFYLTFGGRGVGVGDRLTDFVGVAFTEDRGLFGWRAPTMENYVGFPALLRVDLGEESTALVPLTSLPYRPDTMVGLLATGVAVAAGVILLNVGYRRWRLRQASGPAN